LKVPQTTGNHNDATIFRPPAYTYITKEALLTTNSKHVIIDKSQSASATVPQNMRRMNDPDGAAWIDGLCGDSMEMYLVITEDTVTDACFYTDGCSASQTCGSTAARLAVGKSLQELLQLSPADVLNACDNIPQKNIHCSVLAVSTLHKALVDYLLKRYNG
jgi:nitrogen fixation protein NifU and related proteins